MASLCVISRTDRQDINVPQFEARTFDFDVQYRTCLNQYYELIQRIEGLITSDLVQVVPTNWLTTNSILDTQISWQPARY